MARRNAKSDLGLAHRLPTMLLAREDAEAGALLAYWIINQDHYRRAADYVDRILRGAKPGDLPVEQATKFHLVINLSTAKKLGLTIPASLLARADQVTDKRAPACLVAGDREACALRQQQHVK